MRSSPESAAGALPSSRAPRLAAARRATAAGRVRRFRRAPRTAPADRDDRAARPSLRARSRSRARRRLRVRALLLRRGRSTTVRPADGPDPPPAQRSLSRSSSTRASSATRRWPAPPRRPAPSHGQVSPRARRDRGARRHARGDLDGARRPSLRTPGRLLRRPDRRQRSGPARPRGVPERRACTTRSRAGLARSGPLRPMIQRVFAEEGLPQDLALDRASSSPRSCPTPAPQAPRTASGSSCRARGASTG